MSSKSLLSYFFLITFSVGMLHAAPSKAAMEDYPTIELQALDKTTARTITFEARVGSTIEYGRLFIKVQACRKAPALEKPESAGFLQVWEVPPESEKSEWVFSGWMFASSPALSAMDHPVYDVWVLDCLGKSKETIQAEKEMAEQDAKEKAEAEAAKKEEESEAESEPAEVSEEDSDDVIDEVIESVTDNE